MRVVLDTNVIIAAFATEGLCHAVFEVCLDQHQIVLSNFIIKEVSEALKKKLKLPETAVHEIVLFLKDHSALINHGTLPKQISRDAKDDMILALIAEAHADYLVTGDEDLLILNSYANIPILSPRKFWEALRSPTS
jgi:uncharacterized protein